VISRSDVPSLGSGTARDLAAQFDEAGYAVIERAVPRAVLSVLGDTAQELALSHDFDADREVFRTDDRDSGRDRGFFASARGVRGFLEAEALDASGRLVVAKERAMNKIGHALHDSVPTVREFASSTLVGQAFALAGLREALLVQSMLIFKQPEIGGEVRWHQDASYLRCDPQRVVGLWLALEDADRENGCLWVIPGAHRGPLRERYAVDWETEEGTLTTVDDTPWPEQEAVPLEVPAGSLVVFHDHLPHRSDANRSARSRVALTLHAHDRASVWASDNWLHRGDLEPFETGESRVNACAE
jgi:phytanoyl-CoA hydroxylase